MPKRSAKKRGWNTKLALFVLGLILILLIIGQCIRAYQTLNSAWGVPNTNKSYIWDQNFSINLVLRQEKIAFLSFNPKMGKITIITLPDNLLIEVPKGFGAWQIRSIFNLGESNQAGQGSYLLKQAIASTMGLPVDGVIHFQKGGDFKGLIEDFRKNLKTWEILKEVKTDLALWELLQLKYSLGSVRFDKVEVLDLEELDLVDKKILADGTAVFTTDPIKLDSIVLDLFDPSVKEEYKSVAIFNATSKALLAQDAARITTNLGANVIAIANSPNKVANTYLLGNSQSKTYQRLLQIFDKGCSQDSKCDKIPLENLGVSSQRADIVIILGEDNF